MISINKLINNNKKDNKLTEKKVFMSLCLENVNDRLNEN